ncbi:YciI family protein [Paraburkholderia sp. DHOC27]|uniref:YciI family protein n=1 Tax=Paraburkholderia sp. DHOC27 TaxID=2303330 RepID=UPI000E3C3685|nr:YciI family protein [Paraburkholderia sp. DHOC27]RFU48495.1 dehydrogenase [Paraburkholderia sp. DHOC27]
MAYLLLVVEPIHQRAGRSDDEGRARYEEMANYAATLKERGVLVACESLKSTREGVRVEVRNGERRLIDGPFAEAKEMVGGFLLLNCDTREEAVAIGAACPAATWCSIEVREIGPCYQ